MTYTHAQVRKEANIPTGKTVLVTGATGRVGANLVKSLVDRGYTVRSFVLPGDPYVPGVERPWEIVERALDGRDPAHTWVIPRGPDGRSWMHHVQDVRDTVEGTILALERKEAVGEAFNLMSAGGTAWEEAVRYIFERTGDEYLGVQMPNYWAFESDISKARDSLGYAPQYGIRRMVDDALAWRKGQDLGVIPA